jgi:hypothetical protein
MKYLTGVFVALMMILGMNMSAFAADPLFTAELTPGGVNGERDAIYGRNFDHTGNQWFYNTDFPFIVCEWDPDYDLGGGVYGAYVYLEHGLAPVDLDEYVEIVGTAGVNYIEPSDCTDECGNDPNCESYRYCICYHEGNYNQVRTWNPDWDGYVEIWGGNANDYLYGSPRSRCYSWRSRDRPYLWQRRQRYGT